MNLEMTYQVYKPMLLSIGYSLLGTISEAEDIVQEVFLNLQSIDLDHIDNLKAFLCKSVTNRCFNLLQSANKKKVIYPGTWLPEPMPSMTMDEAFSRIERKEDLSYAYMVMLESLSPMERVVFVLKDLYDYPYRKIAEMMQKSEDNCRKICSRARQKLKEYRPDHCRHENHSMVVTKFINAINNDQVEEVIKLLGEQVIFISDAGGKVRAAVRPITGIERVTAFFKGIATKGSFSKAASSISINGETAMKLIREGLPSIWSFELEPESGRISYIYAVFNPDKLKPFID